MQEILDKGNTKINIIKKGAKDKEILISPLGKSIIDQDAEAFFKIIAFKNNGDPLFTTQPAPSKPIHRVAFDKEINNVLKKLSLKHIKYHWSLHSLRATNITDHLASQPIQRVARMFGHKNIGTTL